MYRVLPIKDIRKQRLKSGTPMADAKLTDLQWVVIHSTSEFYDDKERCLKGRVEGNMSRDSNQPRIGKGREKTEQKYSRIKGTKVIFISILEKNENENNSLPK